MPETDNTRNQEITAIIEGLWASVFDEMKQTHEPARSQYRFCTVFLNHFAKEDRCECPAMEGPEQNFFERNLLRFLDSLSLNPREKSHILASLFDRLCKMIARPYTLGT